MPTHYAQPLTGEAAEIEALLAAAGFIRDHLGGGCNGYRLEVDDDEYVLITAEDGCWVPDSWDEPALVGVYEVDDDETETETVRLYRSVHELLKALRAGTISDELDPVAVGQPPRAPVKRTLPAPNPVKLRGSLL